MAMCWIGSNGEKLPAGLHLESWIELAVIEGDFLTLGDFACGKCNFGIAEVGVWNVTLVHEATVVEFKTTIPGRVMCG